jgi:hypothetical protein
MYNTFKPIGNMVQLIDGRVFKKNQKNLWEDINTGVAINEQTLNIMISSASFSADASGGGRRRTSTPAGPSTSLSALFDDIVIVDIIVNTFNTNRTIITTEGPLSLRLSFSGTRDSGTIRAYKNDVDIGNLRMNSGSTTWSIPGTFDNGDQLKFSMQTPELGTINFDVAVENLVSPVQTLDTFNISN